MEFAQLLERTVILQSVCYCLDLNDACNCITDNLQSFHRREYGLHDSMLSMARQHVHSNTLFSNSLDDCKAAQSTSVAGLEACITGRSAFCKFSGRSRLHLDAFRRRNRSSFQAKVANSFLRSSTIGSLPVVK